MGPLQANLPLDRGAEIIAYALKKGINFIDTAELYETYPYIKKAMAISGIKPVIATKCYAYDRAGAEKSFDTARKALDLDVIDIFCLHEQESEFTLKGHSEAIEYFLHQKDKGNIKAVGVSTHFAACVEALTKMEEIDVVHPLVNKSGVGIADASVSTMLEAVKKAFDSGKGIYSMKALGGGNLLGSYGEALSFVLELPFIHSVAIGMQSESEVDDNVAFFENWCSRGKIPEQSINAEPLKNKSLHVDYWCTGCGKCVKRCKQGALSIKNGKAVVDIARCAVCGYCAEVCRDAFALKIY
jgi:predicted aldo/keto reductase-like oxidoreductase